MLTAHSIITGHNSHGFAVIFKMVAFLVVLGACVAFGLMLGGRPSREERERQLNQPLPREQSCPDS